VTARRLHRGAAAADEVQDENDDPDNEKDMNQPARDVKGQKTEGPQNQQNDRNRKKHDAFLLWFARETDEIDRRSDC
jgi:hypothetical protein